ncbi:MAG: hypothetical protein H0V17_00775 [Deltaproteobacteria bacterium]|nr:hypothetical protein [Deltaproteobacteria bacterium]
MRAIMVLCCIAVAIVIATMSTSRGDGDSPPGESAEDTSEPITGAPVMPFKGSEETTRDPFAPYGIGGPEAAWRYEDLTAAERAVADRGRADDQAAVQAAYAEVSKAIAVRAKAEAAALQLGFDSPLGETGVVP